MGASMSLGLLIDDDAAVVRAVARVEPGSDAWRPFVDAVVVAPDRLVAALIAQRWPATVDLEAVADLVSDACWQHVHEHPAAQARALSHVGHLVTAGGRALFDGTQGLVVDVGLADRLPLRPLLADVAEIRGSLIVAAIPSGDDPGVDGLCAGDGRSMAIRQPLADPRLVEVVAHETAHLLDPGLATVDRVGTEAFAEELGPLLADHEPATVAEAAPLILEVLDALEPRRIRPPIGSPAALLAWAVLEVTGPTTRQRRSA